MARPDAHDARHEDPQLPQQHMEKPGHDEALDRRSSNGCSCSDRSDSLPGTSPGGTTSPSGSNPHSRPDSHGRDDDLAAGAYTPPPFSSPSVPSSLAFSKPRFGSFSPLRREPSRTTTTHDDGADGGAAPLSRQHLARRLAQLAQRLTYGDGDGDRDDDVDELALGGQLDQLEKALGGGRSPPELPRRPASFDVRSRSDAASVLGSPGSPLIRSRFSDLSASWHREREAERERETREPPPPPEPPKMGMSAEQAKKVIAEMAKLNDELSTVVSNLQARQEESDHIHELLIERAERAAQRIIFLQNRISYLEQELQENDDELQHLRICLKAVEIQMPPHPDPELQRCIAAFKNDYQALKKKRAGRASHGDVAGVDASTVGSPTR